MGRNGHDMRGNDGERIYGLEAIYPRKSKRVADVLVRRGRGDYVPSMKPLGASAVCVICVG